MIKSIPLIQAELKGFVRNWKSVLLLIIFPLLLISVVFLSFSPEGLRKIDVGMIDLNNELNLGKYTDTYLSYLSLTKYNYLENCLEDLKNYKQYVCIEVVKEAAIVLRAHYDNTKEPVIWEVLERIKGSVELLQKQKSKGMVSDFLAQINSYESKINQFGDKLSSASTSIDDYIIETDSSILILSRSKDEASQAISNMDRDLASIKRLKTELKSKKDALYETLMTMFSTNEIMKQSITMNQLASDSSFAEIDRKINNYEQMSANGKQYISQIDIGIAKLIRVKQKLLDYKNKIKDSQQELVQIQKGIGSVKNFDAEMLVSPIILRNAPVYIPEISLELLEKLDEKDLAKKISKGISLIGLQTLFPNMLFLITLFLSLLISSFVCLTEINSSASQRIRLIKGIFIHELLSLFFSSAIIVSIPLFFVVLLGILLFQIPIISNLLLVVLILFLVSSIFILLGLILAHLIKKESITLLVCAFTLVFLIFLSGFLLPVERMSFIPGLFAEHFPLKIALSTFNRIVFYSQGFSNVLGSILLLVLWLVSLILIAIVVKKMKG